MGKLGPYTRAIGARNAGHRPRLVRVGYGGSFGQPLSGLSADPTPFTTPTTLANRLAAAASGGASFTSGRAEVHKFGTHEIELTGNGSVENPFETVATVTFTPPSGKARAKTVDALYDGGNG